MVASKTALNRKPMKIIPVIPYIMFPVLITLSKKDRDP